MLQNPIDTDDFRWLGKIHHDSHTPLISHETLTQVAEKDAALLIKHAIACRS